MKAITGTYEDIIKIENFIQDITNNDENTIKLITGTLINASNNYITKYWLINNDVEVNIGDYAIVENLSGFAIVKIVGVTISEPKLVKYISNTNYEKMKKVVMLINKEELEKEQNDK